MILRCVVLTRRGGSSTAAFFLLHEEGHPGGCPSCVTVNVRSTAGSSGTRYRARSRCPLEFRLHRTSHSVQCSCTGCPDGSGPSVHGRSHTSSPGCIPAGLSSDCRNWREPLADNQPAEQYPAPVLCR